MERDDRERLLRLGLWLVPGISSRTIAKLRELGLASACALPRRELVEVHGLPEALLEAPADLAAFAAAAERALAARGGRFFLAGEPGYPDFGNLGDPPEAISIRGSLAGAGAGAEPPAVAVVGSRKCDASAWRVARRMGVALAKAGFTVVSGGALGIDAAAHEGALEAGGSTVAIFGSGVLRPGPPANRKLFARILASGGGLVSELPPSCGARDWHFPRRNRLIAALSRAVVVVRAAWPSGTLYTVEAAHRQGRPVFGMEGGGAGIEKAATDYGLRRIRDPEELIERLTGARVERKSPADLEPGAVRVLDALSAGPVSVPGLAAAAALPVSEVVRILAALCGRGLARGAGAGRFAAMDEEEVSRV